MRILLATAISLSAAIASVAQDAPIFPREGGQLDRLHLRFRWVPFPQLVGDYTLEIVEDDGSAAPFDSGLPVQEIYAGGGEPRAVVTEGLAFGLGYAWRVRGRVGPSGSGKESVIRRFSTLPLHPDVPSMNLIVPPGAEPVEPGVTLWSMKRAGASDGFVLGVDEQARLVLQLHVASSTVGDTRLLDDGLLLCNLQTPDPGAADLCRTAAVMTLDGLTTWASPNNWCGKALADVERIGIHHEVLEMPREAHGGATFLWLEYQSRWTSYGGEENLWWQSEVIKEVDRHTKQVLFQWSVMDHLSLDDHLPPDHPSWPGPGGDWTHANALAFDPLTDLILCSLRRQSRLIAIDRASGAVAWQMGEDSFPSGDVPAGFGDNLFSAQHSPQVLPGGNLLVYDNGNFIEPESAVRQSRAVEIAFDASATPPVAAIVWEYGLTLDDLVTPAYAPAVGDADRLPGGHTITNDGAEANIIEVDANGDPVWFLDAGPAWPTPDGTTPGAMIYRVERVPTIVVDTPGDVDDDGDRDLVDFLDLQASFTGFGPAVLEFPATLSDLDGDDDGDWVDVEELAYWMSGPAQVDVMMHPRERAPLVFCSGTGAGSACPCSNEASEGGCANSTGAGAVLLSSGTTSISADDLVVGVSAVPGGQPVLLFSGLNAVNGGVGVSFGDGLRCVGGDIKRLGVRIADGSGRAFWGPNLAGAGGWERGDVRRLQAWYRDPAGSPCGVGFNLSNGLEVRFVP
ncbi:MAG: hypothetical protein CMJ84_07760 [Planctomycetes bacterium]|nr:hypothetical protein [Planctomycetota bacterium]